jgi:leucyl-tRNA synthetase
LKGYNVETLKRSNDATHPGVDLYVGGTEHAVLHLLYARFWHKVLFDLGHVTTPEPFYKLVNQGLILGEDGQKMSKSRGNVVNPDDVLAEYGADAFRLYEMFMGPLEMVKPWNTKGVEGVYRFLGRVWRLFVDEKSETDYEQAEAVAAPAAHVAQPSPAAGSRTFPGAYSSVDVVAAGTPPQPAGGDARATNKCASAEHLLSLIKLNPAIQDIPATPAQLKTLHTCIKKVTEDLDGMRFNTAISGMMIFVNEAITWKTLPLSALRTFLQLLQPFAPHVAEELWAKLPGEKPIALAYAPWPKFDPALLVETEIELPVQVNGKFRDVIKVPADADNATIEAAAKASVNVQQFVGGKPIKKVIIVPKRMVNIIV